MNSTLSDSNVLIDLLDDESEWRSWSDAVLQFCRDRGPVVINPIIFAEVSSGFTSADRRFACIADVAASAGHPCLTSTSARTLQWPATLS